MKLHKRGAAALLSVLFLLLLLPGRALAAGNIDLQKDVSLTIRDRYKDLPLSGVTFELYLVSTFDEHGELTPTESFQGYAGALDIRGENAEAWALMAEALERDIVLGELGAISPADAATTDGEGVARFPSDGTRLTPGLYLVLGTRLEREGSIYSTAPFMLLLPWRDMEANDWDYTVEANAKPDWAPLRDNLTVKKLWKDDCHSDEPHPSVTVQLMCDGEAYGEPVTLPWEGRWEYTWDNLEMNHTWTVTETPVEGFQMEPVRQEGNAFIITNICVRPVEPTNPTLPQTGQLWWPVPVLIAAGLLLVVIGLIRRRGDTR